MSNAAPIVCDEVDGPLSIEVLAGLSQLHRSVFVADSDGRIVWFSDHLLATLDAADAAVGKPATDFFDGLTLPASDASAAQFGLECGSSGLCDVVRSHVEAAEAAGSAQSFDASLFRLVDEASESGFVIGVLRPTGREYRRDADPREAVDFLSAILDSAPDAVVAIDCFGFIVYANSALERITGHRIREHLDQPAAVFLPRAAGFTDTLATLRPDGSLDGVEIEVHRENGATAWLSISSRMIRLHDGRVAGNVCFIRDVTEQRQIREMLERKNAELESYVHSVSHDLRSPLVSLLGFSRLLREDYGHLLDETGTHFLRRVEQAGRTMETLIQDLLELSRIGRPDEYRTLIDPRAVLLQIQAELKLRLDERSIALELPENPPLVFCDRTRLYQVLSNLLGNALSHMGDCENPTIVVEVHEEADAHHITVSDNGRGITLSDQERIFEVFTSIPAAGWSEQSGAADRSESTGIGLAIVRKIVETHGGRVWVESAEGCGARFHFTLPMS